MTWTPTVGSSRMGTWQQWQWQWQWQWWQSHVDSVGNIVDFHFHSMLLVLCLVLDADARGLLLSPAPCACQCFLLFTIIPSFLALLPFLLLFLLVPTSFCLPLSSSSILPFPLCLFSLPSPFFLAVNVPSLPPQTKTLNTPLVRTTLAIGQSKVRLLLRGQAGGGPCGGGLMERGVGRRP